jgi:uncharacterized protein involved in oxidation of intracellular sulfur
VLVQALRGEDAPRPQRPGLRERTRAYNALRLAITLVKRDREEVRIFLLADAVSCALAGQRTPNGYHNVERMLRAAVKHGARVGLC